MEYKKIPNGWVFWQEKLNFKPIDFEEAPRYWEYICEDGSWNIYYVTRNPGNRRLAQCNIGEFGPESIVFRLKDRDIDWTDCRRVEEHVVRTGKQTVMTGVFWSKEYDGKSVFDLMEKWQKMPYAHIKMVIENEGGSIDSEGIIHKGN